MCKWSNLHKCLCLQSHFIINLFSLMNVKSNYIWYDVIVANKTFQIYFFYCIKKRSYFLNAINSLFSIKFLNSTFALIAAIVIKSFSLCTFDRQMSNIKKHRWKYLKIKKKSIAKTAFKIIIIKILTILHDFFFIYLLPSLFICLLLFLYDCLSFYMFASLFMCLFFFFVHEKMLTEK